MTADDAPIPGFDRVARAARLGLGQLASSDALSELSWEAVQSGARRVQRRRLTALGAAFAVVLLTSGVAVAATAQGDSDHLRVNGDGAPTTTNETTTTPTTAFDPTTTTATPDTEPGVVGTTTTTTAPAFGPPLAGATDLEGTITIPSVMVAEEATPLTLMVRNVTDHPVSLSQNVMYYDTLGIAFDAYSLRQVVVAGFSSDPEQHTLGVGEQRTFTMSITPQPETVGPATVYAGLIESFFMSRSSDVALRLPGVPDVPVMVVPPGFTPGEPLDPSLGSWKAEMSADATAVAIGDGVLVHATLTNVGDELQNTRGYGSLLISCGRYKDSLAGTNEFVDAQTIAPGASATFSFEYRPGEYAEGRTLCWVAIAYNEMVGDPRRHAGLDSDAVSITVVPTGTTTTTVPETTTTTLP